MAESINLIRMVRNENYKKETVKTLRVKKIFIEQQKIAIVKKKFQDEKYPNQKNI